MFSLQRDFARTVEAARQSLAEAQKLLAKTDEMLTRRL